ncbi:MAG: ABC transporter ATP-binding protein [Alicyclobacillus sp.]|nr:ABC transporter ATP-binding protein [Alicyclobacillus sp.]
MITLRNVSKKYPGHQRATIENLNLHIFEGEVHILLGPSGCGKTTLLKMINRLIEPTTGEISVLGKDIRRWDIVELRRRIGYVIQQIGLFPHMTVGDNISVVPRLLKWPSRKIADRVEEMMSLIGLPIDYIHKRPRELSGGQQQRVGVARALAADPPILLMDEPFGAIDPITRRKLQEEFRQIQRRLHKTVVFVTHDIDEAIRLGDRITILKDGFLIQTGTPRDILSRPRNEFVSDLFGDDRVLKSLILVTAGEVAVRSVLPTGTYRASIRSSESLLSAVNVLLSNGYEYLEVIDELGDYVGYIDLSILRGSLEVRSFEGDAV